MMWGKLPGNRELCGLPNTVQARLREREGLALAS